AQLSTSSQRTLLWASALANIRAAEHETNKTFSEINAYDMLIGMLLEHPKDSEPKMLLEHFHLTLGQVLPSDYPRLSKEAIERNLLPVTSESAMRLDPDASNIVDSGVKLGMSSGSSEVAELRALFSAMLETTNPVANVLMGVLDGLGTTLSEVSRSTHEFVQKGAGKESYAEFLNKKHPFSPRAIDIPNYKADHGQQHELADDMVGIRAEVDAFAYLLASRGLTPPLAVGLFGDWGSGKSFFMESVRNRIEQLIQDPKVVEKRQSEVPFWKRIVQIEFNAWHYMEGELWASLVDHIFNQLRMKGDTEDLVKKRLEHWMAKLDHTRAKMLSLESQRKAAENNLRNNQRQAEHLHRQRDSELENLERLKTQTTNNILVKENLNEVQKALEPFLISIGLPTAEEVFQKLDEAQTELKRVRNLLNTLWTDSKWRWVTIGSLVGIPVLVSLLLYLDLSAVTSALSGISAIIATAFTLSAKAMKMIKPRIDILESAADKVNKEIGEARNALNERILASENLIDGAEEQLKSVADEQQNLSNEIKDYQEQLENVTPVRVLTDFVAERVGSGDYRKFLGIPALIQQDFRQLARLVADQNDKILKDKKGKLEKSSETFNRIILYIDDLDRCPDEHVVKVLQAVHLLLAFELFVVVVAVDSRWLSHALTKHFEALAVDRNNGLAATPDDYLEKIFQIPFWIQPLGERAKRNIIQELLRGHLTGDAGIEEQESDINKPTVGQEQIEVLATLDPTHAPPTLQTAALSITRTELKFLDELAPILGTTPRSTKRFVNLYQLVRIIYHLDPDSDTSIPPKQHELLAFVLALGEGLPKLGPVVLKEAVNAEPIDTFETILLKIKPDVDAPEVKRLEGWLATRINWKQIPAVRMAEAFCKIDRFLFRVGAMDEKQRD
ncbi:MAG: hypothetical protein GY774_26695, partial [Planctomycetes bacterium]|nr:hypothetical protein [Planctomycetota bacterium]